MAEQPSPKRRVFRRAVIALAVSVLLVSGYIASYGAANWLEGRWHRGNSPSLSPDAMMRLDQTLFAPIHVGAASKVPYCRSIQNFGVWCHYRGEGKYVPLNGIPLDQ
jgi:hypothetical protein